MAPRVVFVKEIVPAPPSPGSPDRLRRELRRAPDARRDRTPPHGQAGTGRAAYVWKRAGRWESVEAEVEGPSVVRAEGTEEAFVTEHYWGYAGRPDAPTNEYAVLHPPWTVRRAVRARLDCDVAASTAANSLPPSQPSRFRIRRDGSDIVVRRGARSNRVLAPSPPPPPPASLPRDPSPAPPLLPIEEGGYFVGRRNR